MKCPQCEGRVFSVKYPDFPDLEPIPGNKFTQTGPWFQCPLCTQQYVLQARGLPKNKRCELCQHHEYAGEVCGAPSFSGDCSCGS